jgi:transposase-like protein
MKQNPKATAYNLYFQTNLTQAQIAERVGVSTRTLYDWMKQGNWKTLKANSRLMPAQIVDDIYNHISHLNWKIKTRDFEDRYPSKEEAETLRKLISTIPKIKLNVSKGESAQAMINFVSWLQTRNNDAAIFISDFIDEYLHAGRERGMEPYEFEYDADQYYNPTDYPWRQSQTFEERVNEDIPLSRGDVPQTTDVVSEQGCVQPGPAPQPDQGTDQKDPHPRLVSGSHENTNTPAPETPPTSLRGTKQPRQNTDNLAPDNPQKPEPNQRSRQRRDQNQIGSKSEAPKTSNNPTKRPDNQAPDIKKLPDPTSENKMNKKPEETTNDDIRDRIQKVFESWQKEIKKGKRRL